MGSKNTMSDLTKAKLIYSGELILISLIALIFGFLQLFGVMIIKPLFTQFFRYATLVGGLWIIADFIWALADKKRRNRISLVDKIINLPLGIYLVAFDIITICKGLTFDKVSKISDLSAEGLKIYHYFQLFIPLALIYLGLDYMVQAIYHWYKPLNGIISTTNDEEKEEHNEGKNDEQNKE